MGRLDWVPTFVGMTEEFITRLPRAAGGSPRTNQESVTGAVAETATPSSSIQVISIVPGPGTRN